jgi:hypothetical protein
MVSRDRGALTAKELRNILLRLEIMRLEINWWVWQVPSGVFRHQPTTVTQLTRNLVKKLLALHMRHFLERTRQHPTPAHSNRVPHDEVPGACSDDHAKDK